MSLTSAFQLSADRNPGKMAVGFASDGLTFSEFHRLSRNIAHNLIAAGAETR
jgi:hypothetical protein